MKNIGNINYSLNKNDVYKILIAGVFGFIPFYYILVVLSVIYIITIRFQQYYFKDKMNEYKTEDDIIHYFRSITYNSPFNILSFLEYDDDGDKYCGLSNRSYFFIIVSCNKSIEFFCSKN